MKHERFSSDPLFDQILAGSAVLKRGDKGDSVAILQSALADMGFPMMVLKDGVGLPGVDGVFGGQTETALTNFQVHARKNFADVCVNGVLDAPAMRALVALAPAQGKKAWDAGQPNLAPIPHWNGSQPLRVVAVKDEHRTFVFDDVGKCTGIFPNAHGTAGNETDCGLKKVRTKLDEAAAQSAGTELWNAPKAFGKRILDLCWESGVSHGEELHGTYEYHTMGKDVSHGCVRHYNEDIIRIFDAVSVGDFVAVVPSINDARLRT
jgi:peptidoglycan hydrolase-like protein with peptidoglycan-binding domain